MLRSSRAETCHFVRHLTVLEELFYPLVAVSKLVVFLICRAIQYLCGGCEKQEQQEEGCWFRGRNKQEEEKEPRPEGDQGGFGRTPKRSAVINMGFRLM